MMLFMWSLLLFIIAFLIIFIALVCNLHRLLVSEDEREKGDAILVLSDGNGNGDREAEAAKLYHEGYCNKIILTGTIVGWKTYSSHIMREHLIALQVPDDAIYEYTGVTSTRDEAELAKELLEGLKIRKLLLVTNKYHSARSKWIFKKTYKNKGVKIVSVPVREDTFNRNWWKDHETRKQGVSEILKFFWEILRL
ncbi:YdcF family protein [Evansella sp. AB-P1]|uniref:YdcF family protein n=1 Tax=Evansella sp. AB-P1 TaxID=3037653 RepID=UPI00241ED84D|nr:YdcF family protein [Evansella sp. AB-P1]MDG5786772.1 YdcF family protein [Evansella sp. AB-P1]